MTFNNVMQKIHRKAYEPSVPYPTKANYPVFPPDHVFDDTKSVKWNREESQRYVDKRHKALNTFQAAQKKAMREFEVDLIQAIMNEYNFNNAQAEQIQSRAWEQSHSEGLDAVVHTAEDIACFIDMLNKTAEK